MHLPAVPGLARVCGRGCDRPRFGLPRRARCPSRPLLRVSDGACPSLGVAADVRSMHLYCCGGTSRAFCVLGFARGSRGEAPAPPTVRRVGTLAGHAEAPRPFDDAAARWPDRPHRQPDGDPRRACRLVVRFAAVPHPPSAVWTWVATRPRSRRRCSKATGTREETRGHALRCIVSGLADRSRLFFGLLRQCGRARVRWSRATVCPQHDTLRGRRCSPSPSIPVSRPSWAHSAVGRWITGRARGAPAARTARCAGGIGACYCVIGSGPLPPRFTSDAL